MQDQVRQERVVKLTPRPSANPGLKAGDRHYQDHLNPREADNHLQSALNEYARALEQNPDSAQLTVKMAKVFLRLGQEQKAEQSALRALSLCPQQSGLSKEAVTTVQAETYLVLGTLAYHHDDLKKAEGYYNLAQAKSPLTSSAARFCLYKIQRNQLLSAPLKPTALFTAFKALYWLSSAAVLFPFTQDRLSFSNLLLLFPQILNAWLKEEMNMPQEALLRYLSLHQQFPGLPSITLIVGELYRENGKQEEARYWFEKAIDRHPDYINAYYHLARLLEEQEDYPAMAKVYESLLALTPNNADLQCNLANACYYMGNYTKAMTHYATALQLGQDNQWKALVAQSMGNIQADYLFNPQSAIAYYEMACLLNPDDEENYIQLGMLYFQQDDFENAEVIYRKALRFSPKRPKLYSNLGYLRWMANDVEQAIAFYEQAIALDAHYEIPINNLGVIHLDMLGQVNRAIELFQQALALEPNYALAHYNLGRAYSFLGNRLEAAQCFQQAQALNHYSQDLDHDELTARIHNLFDSRETELRE
ncbi:tetratricopeptide repeat protein [Vampirovibrio sp.]|uniref:tetratricopeptide repeat protein n=1 Tax=Vampirovibrio sp. TaxID=2717857 RepID=UPI0035941A67